jgi:hypothetical protein
MGMYCVTMLKIALELAQYDECYEVNRSMGCVVNLSRFNKRFGFFLSSKGYGVEIFRGSFQTNNYTLCFQRLILHPFNRRSISSKLPMQ